MSRKWIALIVWNIMLTTAVIAMSFRLARVGAEANAVFKEQIVLLDKMAETDEALMRASENHSTAIMANSESIIEIIRATTANTESSWALFEYANTLSEKITRDITEIYQGHIIPLRALHMSDLNE